jgi:hypothetical protein
MRSASRALVVAGLVGCGCASTTVNEETVHSSVKLRRVAQDGTAPSFTSEWELDDRTLSGIILAKRCALEREWTATRTRTTVKTPDPTAGTIMVVAGVGVSVPSLVLLFVAESGTEVAAMSLGVGCILTGLGATTLAMDPKSKTEVVGVHPHRTTSEGPCVLPDELQNLGLVARVGPKRLVRVPVAADGNAGVTIPDDVELVPGVEIPIVVFRPPRGSELFRAGQVLGRVRVE